jgi:hypothetical protein
MATDHVAGKLLALNATTFARELGSDREFTVGFGISRPRVAWNPDTNEFLLRRTLGAGGVDALDEKRKKIRRIIDFGPTLFAGTVSGLAYLPSARLVAVGSQDAARGIGFFSVDSGQYVSRIALDDPAFPSASWRPTDVAFLPPGDSMALRVSGFPLEVRVVTRAGSAHPSDPTAVVPTALPTIALAEAPMGGGLAVLEATGELMAGQRLYDPVGNVVGLIDLTALKVAAVASITPISSGVYAGDYALIENGSSELVIFSLP